MEIVFTPSALSDLNYWKRAGNKIILKKIRELLEAIENEPFHGIGKPEALKHNWNGCWSRRISHEHRLICKVEDEKITVYALRFHY